MRNTELTSSEKKALRFYVEHLQEHGKPPTMRALAAFMGSPNPNAGQNYVNSFRKKGFLETKEVAVETPTRRAKKALAP